VLTFFLFFSSGVHYQTRHSRYATDLSCSSLHVLRAVPLLRKLAPFPDQYPFNLAPYAFWLLACLSAISYITAIFKKRWMLGIIYGTRSSCRLFILSKVLSQLMWSQPKVEYDLDLMLNCVKLRCNFVTNRLPHGQLLNIILPLRTTIATIALPWQFLTTKLKMEFVK